MQYNILLWYKRSEIEEIIEKKLSKLGLNLSLPEINYKNEGVTVNRKIELQFGKSQKRIMISREFSLENLPIEDAIFDLEKNARASISDLGDDEGYVAFCHIYHNNRTLSNLLKKQQELKILLGEERERMNRYDITGNIKKLAEILVDYWVRKFKK